MSCAAQTVISEEKGQCFRVLGSGQGSSSCSLPILRNITKQICCCSRVGKAWGSQCQRCPYFGSGQSTVNGLVRLCAKKKHLTVFLCCLVPAVAFREICPAGPGYQYSASALQFNQRVNEQLGNRGASLVTHVSHESQGTSFRSSSSMQYTLTYVSVKTLLQIQHPCFHSFLFRCWF